MDSTRFDRIAKVFADRKLSRRQALAQGGVGIAAVGLAVAGVRASAAQDATPDATAPDSAVLTDDGSSGVSMLFLQSFKGGTIAPIDGNPDRYTLTLTEGLGQTIYFSDRPDRIVGASPTDQFLAALGFAESNPPNAALVAETAPGTLDIAVIELYNPVFDPTSPGVTYEVEVLKNWESSLEMGFNEAPTDLAALAPTFNAAQLFIDDCPDATMYCHHSTNGNVGSIANSEHGGYCYSWGEVACLPCRPDYSYSNAVKYWATQCNQRFVACNGQCQATSICSSGIGC